MARSLVSDIPGRSIFFAFINREFPKIKAHPGGVRPGKNVGLTPVEASFTEVIVIDESPARMFKKSRKNRKNFSTPFPLLFQKSRLPFNVIPDLIGNLSWFL